MIYMDKKVVREMIQSADIDRDILMEVLYRYLIQNGELNEHDNKILSSQDTGYKIVLSNDQMLLTYVEKIINLSNLSNIIRCGDTWDDLFNHADVPCDKTLRRKLTKAITANDIIRQVIWAWQNGRVYS